MFSVLTWVSADEVWPRALLGRNGVGGANQLVLGHLGVGLGELQPKGLGDLWVEADSLRSDGKISQQAFIQAVGIEYMDSMICCYITYIVYGHFSVLQRFER